MDLISIIEILWRRKIVTIPLIVLTALAAFYVVKVKPPIYEAQSSLLMVPPTPPTSAQIAADPSLAKINPNNPYVNYGDYSVVADTLIDIVTDSANQQALIAQGADPRYTLALSTDYGNPPIVDITGVGRTPAIAIKSAELVTRAAEADLVTMQASEGVNTVYMIKSTQLVTPTYASQSVSSKLRTLIAVLAVGILMLFVAVSLIEAVERRRRDRKSEDPAKARTPESEHPRAPFLSRYRTRPGWAPDGDEGRAAAVARPASGGGGAARGGAYMAPAGPGDRRPPVPAPSAAPRPDRAPGAVPRPDRQPPVPAPSAAPRPDRRPPVAAPSVAPRPDRQPPVPDRQPLRQPPVPTPSARPSPLDRLPMGPAGSSGGSGSRSR